MGRCTRPNLGHKKEYTECNAPGITVVQSSMGLRGGRGFVLPSIFVTCTFGGV